MAENTLANTSQRVGLVKGKILKHVVPKEKLGKFVMNERMPSNAGIQMTFRRWLPTGATTSTPNTWNVQVGSHRINEGETPTAETVVPQDIPVTMDQYAFVYRWSDRVEDVHEDDVPAAVKKIAGQRAGLLLEMIKWGQAKSCTNAYYAAGVASRSLVAAKVSATLIANITRGLENNMAELLTQALKASTGYETRAIDSCYVGFCHPNLRYDLEAMPGFVKAKDYPGGAADLLDPDEVGSLGKVRFIQSPHFTPYLQAGTTATANTILSAGVPNSAGSEAADVYPIVIMAEEAMGSVAFRGKDAMEVGYKPAGEKVKGDILGQRGEMGMKCWSAAVILNNFHMAVAEVACSALIG